MLNQPTDLFPTFSIIILCGNHVKWNHSILELNSAMQAEIYSFIPDEWYIHYSWNMFVIPDEWYFCNDASYIVWIVWLQ